MIRIYKNAHVASTPLKFAYKDTDFKTVQKDCA